MTNEQLQQWFSKLTDASPFLFAILDKQHNYTNVNERYCEIACLSKDELAGMGDAQVLGEHFYQTLKPFYDRAFKGESIETEIVLNDHNQETSLHFSVTPIMDETGVEFISFHAIDTSEKQILARTLQESESKFSSLTELLPDGLLLVENDTIISANLLALELLGLGHAKDLLGEQLSQLFIDETSKKSFDHPLSRYLEDRPIICLTSSRCGIERRVHLSADTVTVLGTKSQIVIVQEVTREEVKAVRPDDGLDLYHDPLTKKYNRLGFTRCLDHFMNSDTALTMFYVDIDNFKNINDSLGHHIGDKVIKEVSERLQRLLPTHAILGHFGGDEFGIIFPEPKHDNAPEELAERIISLVNQPFDLHHFSKRLSCSVGSVRYPGDGHDARGLLQNADTAMFEAKTRGKNRLIKYNDQMSKEARMRLWLEIELQKALQQNSLEVWYQPKVNARDFSINGAEALVRWKHPIEGYISPSAFIPVAEQAGLIEHLGRVVMREVFSTVKRWVTQGLLPGRVAINLSAAQFGNPKLIDYMETLLKTSGVDPSFITFELTESTVMSDSEHTLQMLNSIKNLGFSLSIDDFGTGYSSLSYLARFPIDELKIDRAFINDLDKLPKQVTVIENIINLGRALELSVVAEGVETLQQAKLLSNLNCHTIQGFHFHRPQPREAIETLFSQDVRPKT